MGLSARAAHSATLVLDAERGQMYFDLALKSLSDVAQTGATSHRLDRYERVVRHMTRRVLLRC
jgi:hypothetical protein